MRDTRNSTAPGGNYYQSLLQTKSLVIKGIQTDLHRTIPNNKHFKEGAKGVSRTKGWNELREGSNGRGKKDKGAEGKEGLRVKKG